ncbi:hypothetical protein L1049_005872 [Liquidambar formosana]|uniref:Bidirectional sugar transporter SWEET n=1 Tax=Liquidambar formosana TaxID=63359 RepID=A0AAP0WTE1_LIQFO
MNEAIEGQLCGNVISCFVYLAPLPTFYRIYKRKSTEGFQSLPYVVAQFSALLWLYYALVDNDEVLLITINTFGIITEFVYIAMYTAYASKEARNFTVKLFLSMNVGLFTLTVLLTYFLVEASYRVHVLGWVCAAISVSVFAAPLGIVLRVIRTRSVEFMPFTLSLFLTLSAITWFFYGLLKKDPFVAAPNVLGFIFGVLQMVLYAIYRNAKKVIKEKLPERIINIVALGTSEVHPVDVQPDCDDEIVVVVVEGGA